MNAILDSINTVADLCRQKESGKVLELVSVEIVNDCTNELDSITEVSRCFEVYSKSQIENLSTPLFWTHS